MREILGIGPTDVLRRLSNTRVYMIQYYTREILGVLYSFNNDCTKVHEMNTMNYVTHPFFLSSFLIHSLNCDKLNAI